MTAQVTINLPYKPRRWQALAHKGMRGKRRALLICSRQVGKTTCAVPELASRTLLGPEHSSTCYIAPAQTQARKICYPWIKEYLAPMQMQGHAQFKESEMIVKLPGERDIHIAGAEARDNIRGNSYHTLIVDERDNISDEFMRSVMLPTLSAYEDNFILYIGTLSGGDSKLWSMYQQYKDHPDWYCAVIRADEAGVYSDEQLAGFREELGESAYRREYLCDPHAPVENSVLGEQLAQAEREGRIESFPASEGLDVQLSWDLGIRDACVVWGWQQNGRWLDYIFYREWHGLSFEQCLTRLLAEFPTLRWGECVLPHDAKNRGKEVGFSVEDIVAEQYPGGYYVYQSAPNPVSTLSATRVGMKRCRFEKDGCEKGILRLKSAKYVTSPKTGVTTDAILHDDNSHALDGFRYGQYRIESLHPSSNPDSFPIPGITEKNDTSQLRYFE